MATYKLDATPTLHVGCPAGNNPDDLLVIRDVNDDEPTVKEVGWLDPRKDNDVLVVYGTEIKGDLLRKLGNCTRLRNRKGSLLVNCNGTCYLGAGGQWHRSIDSKIFDWSLFKVMVPNSTNDLLRSQLKQKEKVIEELNQQLLDLKGQLAQKETLSGKKKDPQEDSKPQKMHDHELNLTKLKLDQLLSISSFMQETMNYIKDESNWYRQEITAMRKELSQYSRMYRQ